MNDHAAARSIRSPRLLTLAGLILLAHLAAVGFVGPGTLGSAAVNLLQMAAAVTAALTSWLAARSGAALARPFWSLVAMAFGIWSGGQAFYVYHENWLGASVPSPSWSHFLFRLYGAPLLMALMIGSDEDEYEDREEKRKGLNWPRILDFVQVGILFLFFYFDLYFVSGGPWHGLTGLAMWGFLELSDIENWGLLAAFALRARLSRQSEARALSTRIVPYLLCYAAGSSFYNYASTFWAVRTGEWPDLVFTLSLTVGSFCAATWRSAALEPAPKPGPSVVVNWTPAALPLLTVALALPMVRSEPRVAFAAVFGSVACFGARLILTLYRRQRLLEALRASEARYASLLRLAPDAIFVHVGGRVTFANPATARLLGVASPEELLGRDTVDFAPPELQEQLRARAGQVASDAGIRRLAVVRADGTRVPIDAVAMSFDLPPGAPGPAARLVIARDMTEPERAESERESLIRELEAKNAELERFTYTVSHDLRSPLITITGFLDYVEQAGARGDLVTMRNDLERIRGAAARMDRLLSDLLELSRIGRVLGSPEPVRFDLVCQEAEDLLQGRLRAGKVTVEIEPGLPVVQGDRGRLLEVVQNLLDNAAKFMGDQASPRIWIGARPEKGATVLFVRDNGIGIDPKHHERVFRLFDRLEAKAEGTGVGLALVKRIIEVHGGRVWVESEGTGSGTTVCFTLPIAATSPAQ